MEPIVLITGATDGIGLELARLYEAEGARLVLLGRRALDTLSEPLLHAGTYCQADLADADAAARLVAFLAEQGIERIDLLIHNAAVGHYGGVSEESAQSIANQVAVNLSAPVALTHALAGRLETARGKVLFVSSVVSSIACADFATYAATKAALDGFARSLRVEWRGRIDVQVVHPGAVRTAFHEKASVPKQLVSSPRLPSAKDAAAGIRDVARTRRATSALGMGNKLARLVGRRLGRPMDWLMRRSRG